MLALGEPAAEVAAELGFVDQSHLIRRFKDHFGVTPYSFVRVEQSCTDQDDQETCYGIADLALHVFALAEQDPHGMGTVAPGRSAAGN